MVGALRNPKTTALRWGRPPPLNLPLFPSKYPGYFGNYSFSPTQHNGYLTEEIVMSEASTAKNGTFALAPGYS